MAMHKKDLELNKKIEGPDETLPTPTVKPVGKSELPWSSWSSFPDFITNLAN